MKGKKQKWKADTVELVWHGIRPVGLDERVRDDLRESLEGGGLRKPGSLIFHTVFLTRDSDGPIVHVWGEKDDPLRFHLEYILKPEWVTIGEDANSNQIQMEESHLSHSSGIMDTLKGVCDKNEVDLVQRPDPDKAS